MHNERRILLNTTVLSIAGGCSQIINFIFVASFARTFGAAELGHYATAMAAGTIAGLLVTLGTPELLVREISRDSSRARELLSTLLPLQTILALFAWSAASAATVLLLGDPHALAIAMPVCGYQILLLLASLLLMPFQARERMLIASGGDVLHRLVSLGLGLTAIALGASAAVVASCMVIGVVGLVGYAWLQTSRCFGPLKLRFRPAQAWRILRSSSPFFAVSASAVLYARGAPVILGGLAGAQAVGLYAVAERFMVAAQLGSTMFNAAAYPALARVAASSSEDLKVLSARCLRLLLIGMIPLAVLITVFAGDIVRALFGAEYLDAARALQILAWTLPMRATQSLLGSQLAAMNRQAALAKVRFVGLGLFVILAPLLILKFGYVGAAWAVLVCDSVYLLMYWWLVRETEAAAAPPDSLRPAMFAAVLTLVVGSAVHELSLALRAVFTLGVLFISMWGFGAIKLNDVQFLWGMIARKPRA